MRTEDRSRTAQVKTCRELFVSEVVFDTRPGHRRVTNGDGRWPGVARDSAPGQGRPPAGSIGRHVPRPTGTDPSNRDRAGNQAASTRSSLVVATRCCNYGQSPPVSSRQLREFRTQFDSQNKLVDIDTPPHLCGSSHGSLRFFKYLSAEGWRCPTEVCGRFTISLRSIRFRRGFRGMFAVFCGPSRL